MKRVSECHEEDIGIILAFFGFKPRVSLGFKKIPCEKCHDPARFRDFRPRWFTEEKGFTPKRRHRRAFARNANLKISGAMKTRHGTFVWGGMAARVLETETLPQASFSARPPGRCDPGLCAVTSFWASNFSCKVPGRWSSRLGPAGQVKG